MLSEKKAKNEFSRFDIRIRAENLYIVLISCDLFEKCYQNKNDARILNQSSSSSEKFFSRFLLIFGLELR